MNDLELALIDLSDHLDVPQTEEDPAAALMHRLTALDEARPRRRSRARVLLAAAAAMVVLSAGTIAVAPARSAVAGWLGVGAVEVRTAEPIVTTPSTGTTPTTQSPVVTTDLATARKAVQFEIVMPQGEAPPTRITVDRRVPGGLVTLAYSHFTLVQIATDTTGPAPLMKLVGGAAVEPMSVHGYDGLWIPTVHQIGFIDRAGQMRSDTVRRSGPVLLWERDGVTYRVEGPHTRAEAQAIADSIV